MHTIIVFLTIFIAANAEYAVIEDPNVFLTIFVAANAEYVVIEDPNGPAVYNFAYGVADPDTGDYKIQQESKHGDVVKGRYGLKEPDGTIRLVEYTAGPHTGFKATVRKIGHAYHPRQHYKGHGGDGVYQGGHGFVAPGHSGVVPGHSGQGPTSFVGVSRYGFH